MVVYAQACLFAQFEVLNLFYLAYPHRRRVKLSYYYACSKVRRQARGSQSQPWFVIMQPTLGLFSCLPISAACEDTSGSALIFQPPRPVRVQQPQTIVW